MNITDANYSLPVVHALASFGLLESGTTLPMSVLAVDNNTGIKNRYVVKFRQGNRMSERASVHELLGAWMAAQLMLPAVEPVLVHIDAPFVQTLAGKQGYQAALKSPGLNFGSCYLTGHTALVKSPGLVTPNLFSQALDIFAFDMFISNADRGHEKVNLLTDGKNLVMLDHELAFSFTSLLSFSRNPTPWQLGNLERELYLRHVFYPYLQHQAHDFQPFCEKLVQFDGRFWERARQLIPNEWDKSYVTEIENYLTPIVEKRTKFAESLTSILLP